MKTRMKVRKMDADSAEMVDRGCVGLFVILSSFAFLNCCAPGSNPPLSSENGRFGRTERSGKL